MQGGMSLLVAVGQHQHGADGLEPAGRVGQQVEGAVIGPRLRQEKLSMISVEYGY